MIIFLAVTFFIAYLLHIVTFSGYLPPLYTHVLMFVIAGIVLTGLNNYYAKKKKHRKVHSNPKGIPVEFETCGVNTIDNSNRVFVKQVEQWKKSEHKSNASEDKSDKELARLWRIDTIGEMASMVTHELNQPLCAILNYSNVCMKLMRGNENKSQMTEVVEEISIQAKRARQIIRSLKRLMTNHEPHLSVVNINEDIVREVIRMMQVEAHQKNITIQTRFSDNVPVINVDKIQIMQVVLNLVRNAFDAMDSVKAGNRHVIVQTLLTENQMIEISVKDTGEGLPDENKERVFNTFFTTRPDGLGVGLPLCRRIIEMHGGKIWTKNNRDCGATSTFSLPLNGGKHYGK